MEEDNVEDLGLSDPIVCTLYKASAEVANLAMTTVIQAVKVGAKLYDLCKLGDTTIEQELSKKFTKKKYKKGIAFPTCISINEIGGNLSPLSSDDKDNLVIAEGDLVKIDLGAQIDGYISVTAHTVIATENPEIATTGKKADVICAGYYASEATLRLLKPGNTNTQITEMINKIADIFKVNTVSGVLSHKMKRWVIDDKDCIISKTTSEQKVDEFTIEEGDVYSIDIMMSTGEGKTSLTEHRTNVYKRNTDKNYSLKINSSRKAFSLINKSYPTLPFSTRFLHENPQLGSKTLLGVKEMLEHELLHPYPVLTEKKGQFISQFKFTVLVLPTIIDKLNVQSPPFVNSEFSIEDPTINNLLSMGVKRSKKNKKKKKNKGEGETKTEETPKTEGN